VNNENSIAVTVTDTTAPKAKKAPKAKATAKKTAKATVKGKAKKTAPKATAKGKTAPTKGKAKATTTPTARTTKKGDAIELLRKGISLEKLMDKFGWQRHTVRGFISVLGKTHKIESTMVDGARTYKITK
jgi:hypothetical protein